mmetsp:Transcript_20358/g.37840  ORF Transcript_20358/g.37840 Transcript_20358/m.37840 type:complete len:165 (+) Transcript_20358:103-597(+)
MKYCHGLVGFFAILVSLLGAESNADTVSGRVLANVDPVRCKKRLKNSSDDEKEMWQAAVESGFVKPDGEVSPIAYCVSKCTEFEKEEVRSTKRVKTAIKKFNKKYKTKKVKRAVEAIKQGTATEKQRKLVLKRNYAANGISNRVSSLNYLRHKLVSFCNREDDE